MHDYEDEYHPEHVKFIGVYSTRANAEKVRDHLIGMPGFCDHPEGFAIDETTVDETDWSEGFKKWSDAP